ncbi:MAG: hypothetical protein GY774_35435 [Planctomycetes bacterium]|nr:hypothetical protein [Planctomycetota bacterium]
MKAKCYYCGYRYEPRKRVYGTWCGASTTHLVVTLELAESQCPACHREQPKKEKQPLGMEN